MRERLVEVGGGVSIFVREEGGGFPLLLVHSLALDGEMWAAQTEALRGRFRVIAPDLRGHGRTVSLDGERSLDLLAWDLERLLDRLDIERAAFGGISLGGMLGLRLALRAPNRIASLALLATSAQEEEPAARELYEQVNESSRHAAPNVETCRFMLSIFFSEEFRAAEPALMAAYEKKLLGVSPESLYWTARAVIGRDAILDRLGAIEAPTLVAVPGGDQSIPPEHGEAIARAIPGARLLRLGGSGHLCAVERAREVNEALAAHMEALV